MSSSEHYKAVERLEGARREQDRLGHEYRAAEGTSSELGVHAELQRAREEAAARGRWLEWVESDAPLGSARR
jgi:hypothetical protein